MGNRQHGISNTVARSVTSGYLGAAIGHQQPQSFRGDYSKRLIF